jgi:L-asparagine oxygenase
MMNLPIVENKMTEPMNWIDYRQEKPCNYARTELKEFPERAIVRLSDEECTILSQCFQDIHYNPYDHSEQEEFIATVSEIFIRHLDPERVETIKTQLEEGVGVVLVQNLPTDPNLPDTPKLGGPLDPGYKSTFIVEALLIAIGRLTGAEPFNFRQEGLGTAPLLDNIVPVKKLKEQRGAGGYANNFPFHCESAWHRKRPDYLVLAGVRECPGAKTMVFSVEDLKGTRWEKEAPEVTDWFRLRAPDLYVQMQEKGIPMGTEEYVLSPPVIHGANGLELNVNFNGTDCAHREALEWFTSLEAYIEEHAAGVVLGPGSAIILNNKRTCHTRNGYVPKFDKQDRWFVRGYFKKNLWSNQEGHPNYDLAAMTAAGWMTPEGELTEAFTKYVYYSQELAKLSPEDQLLAKKAFMYTPVVGTRIV